MSLLIQLRRRAAMALAIALLPLSVLAAVLCDWTCALLFDRYMFATPATTETELTPEASWTAFLTLADRPWPDDGRVAISRAIASVNSGTTEFFPSSRESLSTGDRLMVEAMYPRSSVLLTEQRFGFPCRSFYMLSLYWGPNNLPLTQVGHSTLGKVTVPWVTRRGEPISLPLLPLWPGLLCNSAAWYALLLLIAVLTRCCCWAVASRRTRHSRCRRCGFDLRAHASGARCPECGK